MKAFRFGLAFLVCLTLSVFISFASADDGFWGTDDDPCTIDWIGSGTDLDLVHNDAADWKGWANLYVKNWCGQDWGDFHLVIKDAFPWSHTNVDFTDDYAPQLWFKEGLTWVQYTALDWAISPDGSTLDLRFYGNPIEHGEKAWIRAWTDNTSTNCSWFKIGAYPTPVPEPATIALLGLGALGLLRRKRFA